MLIGVCNYYGWLDYAYYKSSFVDVVEIAVYDAILSSYIRYKLKLALLEVDSISRCGENVS
jgi:hypothetical protein